jgi:antitoxin component YwqK of YwqJK toxin-antitoxin module
MKSINTLLVILFISPLSSPSWSVTLGGLVERDGIYYEQFTDVPFTGEVTRYQQGSFKSGKAEGAWVWYWDNGQLNGKGNYKNGKKDGMWVIYRSNGQLKYKGNFENGERGGAWVAYWPNGQLMMKGNFNNRNKEGDWVGYYEDGTVHKSSTGTFKDGEKISD